MRFSDNAVAAMAEGGSRESAEGLAAWLSRVAPRSRARQTKKAARDRDTLFLPCFSR
jgi:hypothetical protein